MSHEAFEEPFITDHEDSVQYMVLRRMINGDYAEKPLDFNEAGLLAGRLALDRDYTSCDIVVDIGSSSGEMIGSAALRSGVKPKIVCVEPDSDARFVHRHLPAAQQNRLTFVSGTGEALPLADNSAVGASLHNVIFRSTNALAMLNEVVRVVAPNGFVSISSNARGHAVYRHAFEAHAAKRTSHITGTAITTPKPPAEGHYMEDLPSLAQRVGGLAIIDSLCVRQDTQAIITRGERLENYLQSIKYSAANTDMPGHYRWIWRQVVNQEIRPFIEAKITKMEADFRESGFEAEPYFADPIIRGMYVLRNVKSSSGAHDERTARL